MTCVKKMKEIIKKINTCFSIYQDKYSNIRTYLICASFILSVFAIWFFNVGLLPFKSPYDFVLFVLLALIFAIYRPGWAFLLFVGAIALENINLAAENLPLALRPYQFLAALVIISVFFQIAAKRLSFALPRFHWYDALPAAFAAAGFVGALFSPDKTASFKQSLVALSFAAIYFLVRIYIRNIDDARKILPFFLSGALAVVIWAILQNVIFEWGGNHFQVMPGRPNSTFPEPDWLGIYLVFVLAVICALAYNTFNYKSQNFSILKQRLLYSTLLLLTFVALILTVSRSAWLGAFFVLMSFLVTTLFSSDAGHIDGSAQRSQGFLAALKMTNLNWRKFFHALQFLTVVFICSIAIVYIFGLTRFQIFNRATSTAGQQKITIACSAGLSPSVPHEIKDVAELGQYNCRHINLEDIEEEKANGYEIREVYRPDPNVNIRAEIYKKSFAEIKNNPILGIGWGSIGSVLGKDERGASLNASNIFLEMWLGAGIIGLLSLAVLFGYIFVRSAKQFLDKKNENKTAAAFVMLGWAAIVIPNLFNSGIFLGFVWVYLAIAVSLVEDNN